MRQKISTVAEHYLSRLFIQINRSDQARLFAINSGVQAISILSLIWIYFCEGFSEDGLYVPKQWVFLICSAIYFCIGLPLAAENFTVPVTQYVLLAGIYGTFLIEAFCVVYVLSCVCSLICKLSNFHDSTSAKSSYY